MAGIPGAGRQNNPKLPFCLITPAPLGYFSLAVEGFEMIHGPFLTARASELVSLTANKVFSK
jgi:hypothetical protein